MKRNWVCQSHMQKILGLKKCNLQEMHIYGLRHLDQQTILVASQIHIRKLMVLITGHWLQVIDWTGHFKVIDHNTSGPCILYSPLHLDQQTLMRNWVDQSLDQKILWANCVTWRKCISYLPVHTGRQTPMNWPLPSDLLQHFIHTWDHGLNMSSLWTGDTRVMLKHDIVSIDN